MLWATAAAGQDVPPGILFNPPGLQLFMAIEYNPDLDEYLIAYTDGSFSAGGAAAWVGHLSPDAVDFRGFTNAIQISTRTGVAAVALTYNDVSNEYLMIWRDGSPTTIKARFLDINGNPIGSQFTLGTGTFLEVDYSPDGPGEGTYLATFFSGGSTRYRLINADSTDPTPVLEQGSFEANTIDAHVYYGDGAGKFLVVYLRDVGGSRKSDLYGRFVSPTGVVSAPFPVDTNNQDQQGPIVTYLPNVSRFLVTYHSWVRNPPDVHAALYDHSGNNTGRFRVAQRAPWEVPGGVVYNETTQTVTFGWRHASDVAPSIRAREWSVTATGGTPVADEIILSTKDAGILGGVARPDVLDPQAAFLWTEGNGGPGIHASFVHLEPPVPDTTSPAAVMDLSGTTGAEDLSIETVTAIDASGEASSTLSKEKTTDGNAGTYWRTPTRPQQDEFIIWDLGSEKDVTGVRLLSRSADNFFPVDYEIHLSADGVSYTPLFAVTGAAPAPGTWVEHDLPTFPARFVRLLITKAQSVNATSVRVELAEVHVLESQSTGGTITLDWTAPGDDGDEGTATEYDVRWSTSNITNANFGSATMFTSGIPSPLAAGTPQSAVVTGLPDERQVFVALKTIDEVGNISPLSNVATVNTPGVPPAAVSDLTASNPTGSTVDLDWTATGDDGFSGQATAYDLRWDTSPINDANFHLATPVPGVPAPKPSGSAESFTVTGLPAETTIYFGIKVIDELGNESLADVSPEPSATTLDVEPPEAIDDLTVSPASSSVVEVAATAVDASSEAGSTYVKENATDGNPLTDWSSVGRNTMQDEYITVDTGGVHHISRVQLLSPPVGKLFPIDLEIQVSPDNVSFTTVHQEIGLPDTKSLLHTFDFPATEGRYVRVYITNLRKSGGGLFYARIAEIEVFESPIVAGSMSLSWTAPGDNGDVGTATAYDLRWSLSPITNANFGSATPFAIPAPKPAGETENVTVTDLPAETEVFFAIKTRDEVPNVSPLSNVASGPTPGVAPAAVSDFTASNPTGSTVELTWTAVGDDGLTGTASSYDIRLSTSPITAANFGAATPVPGIPSPQPSGTPEFLLVTGLDSDTLYFFAIVVEDEVGNISPVNAAASARTLDIVPPAQVTDLSVVPTSATLEQVAAPAVDSSGDALPKEDATDGDPLTAWSSPGRSTMMPEFITLDVGSVRSIGRVRLLSRSIGFLFPEDVAIQLSNDNVTFFTVASRTGLPNTQGMWHEIDFSPAGGRYVKVLATKTRLSGGGLFYAQIAEAEVYEASPSDAVTLSWTAPGDDGDLGTAASYDLRYANSPITTDSAFNAATPVDGEPEPQLAGTMQTFTFSAPEEGVPLHFVLRTVDDSGNLSPRSNNAETTSPVIPPAAVSDLAITNVTSTSFDLSWTATGDDGLIGQATAYDVRYSTAPITDANFGSATQATGEPAPGEPGTPESMTLSGLSSGTTFHVAMRVRDETTTPSALSNVVSATTETPDVIAPEAVTDLSGGPSFDPVEVDTTAIDSSGDGDSFPKENATDGNVLSAWSTPGRPTMVDEFITVDTGAVRDLGQVRLRSSNSGFLFPEDLQIQVSDDNATWTTVSQRTGLSNAQATWHSFDFVPVSGRYVRIYVTKSRLSAGGLFYVQISEIEVFEAEFTGGLIIVGWTAPGDDADVGTAAEYDLRWSTSPITNANFGSATPIPLPPPSPAGTIESFEVDSLPGETQVYLALKTRDEVPNISGLSNVLLIETPGAPPAPVDDLAASNPTGSSIDLDWTATGDDGVTGTASSYDLRWSTSPIDESNFGAATVVPGVPAPGGPGAGESFTVTGLPNQTLVYFAIKVADELGNLSPVNTNLPVSLETLDGLPPAAVSDLAVAATSSSPTEVEIVAIDASGEALPKEDATDGDVNTAWSSPARTTMTTEFITVDTGAVRNIGRVRLQSRSIGFLFPEDLQVQVSDDNATWTTVAEGIGLSSAQSTWHEFDFAASGRYVRIFVTKTRLSGGGLYYAQIAEIEVYEPGTPDKLVVTWTAPGDDGTTGTATAYHLRYSTSPISNNTDFSGATPVAAGAPSPPGSLEGVTIDGLGSGTYYVALKTEDDQGNLSPLSNLPSGVTLP